MDNSTTNLVSESAANIAAEAGKRNRVLILLDGSAFRRRILPYVQQFLRPEDTHLILVRVADPPQSIYYVEGPIFVSVDDAASEAEISTQLREELADTKALLEAAGYTVSREIRFGSAGLEIERFIKEAKIDLVAMTTYARSGISKLLYGSIAEHLMRKAQIPVMVLHPADS
ncbi:MAG: universal stress protein [Caldilineaceae bacterium]